MAAHHYIPYCEKNPHDAFTTNVCGTLNLVEAAREAKSVKKFFLASTGDVYAPSSYPHSETDQPSPVYVYGETKLMAEMLVKRYHNSVQAPFDITIGRLFNAAGPRETNPHLLPEIVRQISTGTTTIEVGNTWPMRDFVDVRSMATTIREITEKTIGVDVFNIGSGKVQPVQNALDLLIKAHGRDVTVVSVEARKRANDRPYLCPAVNKLQNAIGHAAVSFGDRTAKAIWDEPPETRILYR
jgi:UDP-glucose 4-epimerase